MLDRASMMLDQSGVLHFDKGQVTVLGKTDGHDFSEFITTKIQGKPEGDIKVNLKKMHEIVKHIDAELIHIGIRDKQPITLRPEGKTSHTCILAVG
jgi:DNA polymerase III sliding clamp (beta) subunit (PCNA family)